MAIVYCATFGSVQCDGITRWIGVYDTADQFTLPDPPPVHKDIRRAGRNCGSGPYYCAISKPNYGYDWYGWDAHSSLQLQNQWGQSPFMYDGWCINPIARYTSVGNQYDFGYCIAGKKAVIGSITVGWNGGVTLIQFNTETGLGNMKAVGTRCLAVFDSPKFWVDTSTNEGTWQMKTAIEWVLNSVENVWRYNGPYKTYYIGGVRIELSTASPGAWQAFTYIRYNQPTVWYDEDINDAVKWLDMIYFGWFDHEIKQVCAEAYLGAVEQLPTVSADGVANIMEGASLLKGVAGKFTSGFNTFSRDIASLAKSVSDPRDDWLTWRYVYNTTKMDIDEMSDVLSRCKDFQSMLNSGKNTVRCQGFASDGAWSAKSTISVDIASAIKPGTIAWADSMRSYQTDWAARVAEAPPAVQSYLRPEVYGTVAANAGMNHDPEVSWDKADAILANALPATTLTASDWAYMWDNNLFPFQYKGAATLDYLESTDPMTVLDSLGARLTPSNAWDIIPFSFVADWFFNIGNTLSQAEAWNEARHVVLADEWMSITRKRHNGYVYMRARNCHPSLPPLTTRKTVSNKTIAYRVADSISLFT